MPMSLKNKLGDWYSLLAEEFTKEYMQTLAKRLRIARQHVTIFPPQDQVFRALSLTSPSNTKIVLIGQDPYYNADKANGLSFSVNETLEIIPPSLHNIFVELEEDYQQFNVYHNPDLTRWAKQGVLLLNRTLTVQEDKPNSHSHWGWKTFTDKIIEVLDTKPRVFILWGRKAQEVIPQLSKHHLIIASPHPSPMSASKGFFDSKPFSRANKWLIDNNKTPIKWIE